MSNPTLDHLLTRRSVSANALSEPGPDESQLAQILTAAARVPDHKKLVPWRFVLFQGPAREDFGRVLAEACQAEEPAASAMRLQMEGITLIMIEHRLRELFQVTNRVMVLNFGEKVMEGSPEEVMSNEKVKEAYFGSQEAEEVMTYA